MLSLSSDGLQDAFFPLLGNLSQFHIFCSTPLPEEFGESSVGLTQLVKAQKLLGMTFNA